MRRMHKFRIYLLSGLAAAVAIASLACTGSKDAAPAAPADTPGVQSQPTAAVETVAVSNAAPAPAQVKGDVPAAPAATPSATPSPLPAAPASAFGEASADDIVAAQEQLLTEMYDRVVPSIVRIESRQGPGFGGEGSGFVWDTRGHILTNYHVVQGAQELLVLFSDGSDYVAKVVGSDPDADLAVIKIDAPASRLKPVELGVSGDLKPGQMAVAIGNPFGQDFTMTTGIISAVGRVIQNAFSNYRIPSVIQTDAAINPGNSGGPLFDRHGRVIGINAQIRSDSRQSSGVGFAVPIDLAKRVAPSLIEKGHYEYAYLGISGQDLNRDLRAAAELPEGLRGALLQLVSAGGPAELAGLRGGTRDVRIGQAAVRVGGDVVVSINGTPVKAMDDLIAYLALNTSPGDSVKIGIVRDGKEMTVDLKLGNRPRQ
jgi:2-alkenal reductase